MTEEVTINNGTAELETNVDGGDYLVKARVCSDTSSNIKISCVPVEFMEYDYIDLDNSSISNHGTIGSSTTVYSSSISFTLFDKDGNQLAENPNKGLVQKLIKNVSLKIEDTLFDNCEVQSDGEMGSIIVSGNSVEVPYTDVAHYELTFDDYKNKHHVLTWTSTYNGEVTRTDGFNNPPLENRDGMVFYDGETYDYSTNTRYYFKGYITLETGTPLSPQYSSSPEICRIPFYGVTGDGDIIHLSIDCLYGDVSNNQNTQATQTILGLIGTAPIYVKPITCHHFTEHIKVLPSFLDENGLFKFTVFNKDFSVDCSAFLTNE